MIISNRGRSNWSKCKRAAATLVILLFTLVLAHAESIGARAKTWIEIKAAHKAAVALANQSNDARTTALPSDRPVTSPDPSTSTIDGAELLQCTSGFS